ncbi:Lrp/AsnC family transcriptional regulator [Virgisporangium aurantiacum]
MDAGPKRRISTSAYAGAVEIDMLDRRIIHALRVHGRAGFREMAAVLGVSDQTVARRYRTLRERAGVRVVARPDPIRLGYERWIIRLHTAPGAAEPIAAALARRPDTTWVSIMSAGTEIGCNVEVPVVGDRDSLLLQKLPRTPRLVSVSAHCVIHSFAGGAVGPDNLQLPLTPAEVAGLAPPPADDDRPAAVADSDRPLLDALSLDGRLTHAQLATATGWSESAVRRRLDDLIRTGTLYFDVEVDPDRLGFHARVLLWLAVAPSRLASVGAALASHEEIVFAAATTGATNVVATVICSDMEALYRYLTERVGVLDGVERVETAPLLRHVKQVGSVR